MVEDVYATNRLTLKVRGIGGVIINHFSRIEKYLQGIDINLDW